LQNHERKSKPPVSDPPPQAQAGRYLLVLPANQPERYHLAGIRFELGERHFAEELRVRKEGESGVEWCVIETEKEGVTK
jgi:hypothetical protein